MTVLHKNLPASERHPIHSYEFDDSTARLAIGEYAATDVLRIALQLDNYSLWLLSDVSNPGANASPTWFPIGSSVATVNANSPIPGLPAAFDTPAKIATAIQSLQGFQAANDANNNLIVDTSDDVQNAPDAVSVFEDGLV